MFNLTHSITLRIVLYFSLFYLRECVFAAIVSSPSKPLSVVVGKDVNFEWTTSANIQEVSWGKKKDLGDDVKPVLIYVSNPNNVQIRNTGAGESGESYSGRISFTGDLTNKKASFKIANVQPSDAAVYGFRVAEDGASQYIFELVTLQVVVPPNITQPKVSSHYNKGEKVNITCQATGNPMPSIKWIRVKDNSEYPSASGTAHLVFNSVGKDDAGKYKCKATNEGGNLEVTVDLVVYYKPSITQPTESPYSQTVWVAVDNKLECTADGSPEPTITWTKNGASFTDKVEQDGNTGTLTLASVSRATEDDQYICTATNSRGKVSATFKLALGAPGTEPTTPAPTDPNAGARGDDDGGTGVLIGAVVGAVVGVLIIVILIVYFIKCRKGNRGNRAPRPVGLKERGTKSVSDIDDYEPVTAQNELPQYASVDRSKKFHRKPDLNYAELDHRGAERSVDQRPGNRRSEPTTYADIVQTWEPTNESTYANVPRGGQYSNDML